MFTQDYCAVQFAILDVLNQVDMATPVRDVLIESYMLWITCQAIASRRPEYAASAAQYSGLVH